MKRVTLKAVAEVARVHPATVSRALQGLPGVSEEVRVRVKREADRLGYRPDPALRALVDMRWDRSGKRRAPNLCYLLENARALSQTHRGYLRGIRAASLRLGYGMDLLLESDYPREGSLDRVLKNRGTQLLLFSQGTANAEWVPKISLSEFAVVVVGSQPAPLRFHQVRPNFYQGIELAWIELTAMGFKKVGFAHVASHLQVEVDERRRAFWHMLRARDTGDAERCSTADLDVTAATDDQIRSWYRQWQPQAIIGTIPLVHHRLSQAGIDCPYFSVSALGDAPGAWCAPEAVGSAAVHLGDSLYREGDRGPCAQARVLLIAYLWRSSLAVRKGASARTRGGAAAVP